jgi:hypothetical protein
LKRRGTRRGQKTKDRAKKEKEKSKMEKGGKRRIEVTKGFPKRRKGDEAGCTPVSLLVLLLIE